MHAIHICLVSIHYHFSNVQIYFGKCCGALFHFAFNRWVAHFLVHESKLIYTAICWNTLQNRAFISSHSDVQCTDLSLIPKMHVNELHSKYHLHRAAATKKDSTTFSIFHADRCVEIIMKGFYDLIAWLCNCNWHILNAGIFALSTLWAFVRVRACDIPAQSHSLHTRIIECVSLTKGSTWKHTLTHQQFYILYTKFICYLVAVDPFLLLACS